MNEDSGNPDEHGKPEDFTGLRAELATLVDHLVPFANELWPRLENHRGLMNDSVTFFQAA